MTGDDELRPVGSSVVGGPAQHIPVLREEVIAALAPERGGLYLDATFGGGGYTAAILAHPDTQVVALDRDPAAVAAGLARFKESGGRLRLLQARFAKLETALESSELDGAAFDLGVSSMQLDQAERGFSFRHDGPLDMRMASSGRTAAELVNTATEEEIADILFYYGEERMSRRIARAIVADRVAEPFSSTKPLADLVARLVPHKRTDIHPATRTFQALRIAVNDELGELVSGLVAAERALKPGGRLAVVTFHSLEDRIVKLFFAKRSGKGQAAGRRLPGEPPAVPPSFTLPTRRPVEPADMERLSNPRARSDKLRTGIRT